MVFKRENPGMTFRAVVGTHLICTKKSLTPEEKATWEAQAQQDKAKI
jgi:hypothetical protein